MPVNNRMQKTRERSQQHRAFDANVQHAGAFGKCFPKRREQYRSREPQAGREPCDTGKPKP